MAKAKKRRDVATLSPLSNLIDTHCHLDMGSFADDLDDVLKRANDHKITTILSIGIDEDSSRKAVQLAHRYRMIFATIGIHPHDVDNILADTFGNLSRLAEQNRTQVVGYGEIGLDYMKNYSPPETQRQQFRNQLDLARDLKLPVIIHDREAHEDTLTILRQAAPFDHGGVLHCFSGDYTFALQIIDLGLHLSIPGIVTFKNSRDLQEVATRIPLDTMLLETDGPFLAPEPWRGKRNEPYFILYTAEKIAQLRDIDLNDLADQTTSNARKLFHLPK